MTTTPAATGYRAEPVVRTVKVHPDKPNSETREVDGWQCTCGANEGKTVLATAGDARNAADMHTRQSHMATWIGDLVAASESGALKVGATVLGDVIRYVQPLGDGSGTYFETAAGGRYTITVTGGEGEAERHAIRPYTSGSTRPE